MITVNDISLFINSIAPYNTQCQWDNSGLLVGDGERAVKKVGVVLDLTDETLAEAEAVGTDLIITHHPLIFKAQKSFLKGNPAFEAAVRGISVISAHTCFDCANEGVNDVLCKVLGIENVEKISSDECVEPMLRIGTVEEREPAEFASFAAKALNTTCRCVLGKKRVKKAAVCGGSGMDFLYDAVNAGADVYITGDISHHQMLEAQQTGITVIAAGHFETENPAMENLKERLQAAFPEISFQKLHQSNPVTFIS